MGKLKRALTGLSRLLRRRKGVSPYAKARYRGLLRQYTQRLAFHKQNAELASTRRGGRRDARQHRRDYKQTLRAKRILVAVGGPKLVSILRREGLAPTQIDSFLSMLASTKGAIIREGNQHRINLNVVLEAVEADRRKYLQEVQRFEQRQSTDLEQLLEAAGEQAGTAPAGSARRNFENYYAEALAERDAHIKALRALIRAGH